jgi:c-di-GMP-binding flagellar brake protein YcgR
LYRGYAEEAFVSYDDRREFKRLHAPVFCRPVGGFSLFSGRRKPIDISLGGMRIYSDDDVKKGTRMELELFLPDGSTVTCQAQVMWTEALPVGGPARYDVGVQFIDVKPDDRVRLEDALLDGVG